MRGIGSPVQDYPEDVLVDDAGNSYICGFFRDTLTLGSFTLEAAGNTDVFVAKYDPAGQVLWARRYGWFAEEFAHGMAFDTDGNLLLVGEYQDSTIFDTDTTYSLDTLYFGAPAKTYDVFVLTISPAGDLLEWRADGWFASEHFYEVNVDSRNFKLFGGLFRVHNFFGGGLWGKGYDEAFLVLMDTTNAFIWKATAMGRYFDRGTAVDIIGDSIYLMGGVFQDTCWFRDSTVYSVTDFEDDIFVVAWDSSRTFRWVQTGGSNGRDHLDALEANALGEIYICGRYDSAFSMGNVNMTGAGELDGFLAKLDPNGNVLWAKSIGGKRFDAILDLELADDGTVLVTGYYQGQADFFGTVLTGIDSLDQQTFVAAFDPNGNMLWINQVGGASIDKGTSVDVDAAGYVYVYGAFTGTANFGQVRLTSGGSEDMFLMRMQSDGSVDQADQVNPLVHGLGAWPNPSNGNIRFGFSLAKPADVSLSIIDIHGRVQRGLLVDQRMEPGTHSLDADLLDLPAGVYFYTLEVGGTRTTKKIVLVR